MKFRTELKIPPYPIQIDHNDQVCLLGSCFSSNIGDRLGLHKFRTAYNFHGTLFNPASIERILTALRSESELDDENEQFVERDGLYFSLHHHSSLHHKTHTGLLSMVASRNANLESYLENSSIVFITLGTAWVYELRSTGEVIANCQKLPAKYFSKRLLKFEEIVNQLKRINQTLLSLNPSVNIVYTLSPVRHIKDGIAENSLSKALLRAAISTICDADEPAHYFPSYEIMMDDLRDYRFYTDDMLHPNEMAIDYIWQKFSEAFFDEATCSLNKEIHKIVTSSLHKPIAVSAKVNEFARKNLTKIERLERQLGRVDFSSEKNRFEQMLT